jgi:hypothetical protein
VQAKSECRPHDASRVRRIAREGLVDRSHGVGKAMQETHLEKRDLAIRYTNLSLQFCVERA